MVNVRCFLLPSLVDTAALKDSVAVVIDVLRATTSMAFALAHGCEGIAPQLTVEDALAYRKQHPHALLGGERKGLRLPLFDLGNSPAEYGANVSGRRVCMTTTNGTLAIHASRASPRIMTAAFVNAAATVAHIQRSSLKGVAIVCAGTDGSIAREDVLCAGLLVQRLLGDGAVAGNDAALLARDAWVACQHSVLRDTLAHGLGGRSIIKLGFTKDVATAARVDALDVAAVLDPTVGLIRRAP